MALFLFEVEAVALLLLLMNVFVGAFWIDGAAASLLVLGRGARGLPWRDLILDVWESLLGGLLLFLLLYLLEFLSGAGPALGQAFVFFFSVFLPLDRGRAQVGDVLLS